LNWPIENFDLLRLTARIVIENTIGFGDSEEVFKTVVFLESQKLAQANGLMKQLLWRSRPLIELEDVGGDPKQGHSTQ
jgi:hypothetical protein